MKMNSKGTGETLMFFTFFVIITIVAAGIFWSVQSFYGKSYDFRSTHAEILAERIASCIAQKDFFAVGFNLTGCGIYFPSDEQADYLIYVNNSAGQTFISGVRDYVTQCDLWEKNPEYARCARGEVMRRDKNISYMVGVNRVSRRIA